MADKKMNELATASDANYIYAEASNGQQIRISKADLASVVAGVIALGIPSGSANDIKTNSCCDTRNLKDTPVQLGILLTLKTGGVYDFVQIFFQRAANACWFRTSHNASGYESEWRQISK